MAAQPALTSQAALVRVLQASPAQPGWFSPEFVTQIPPAQIDSIVKQYLGQFGAFQRAEGSGSSYTVFLERGSFPAKIVLDPQGRITGLWFGLAEPLQASTLDESIASFAKLPGKIVGREHVETYAPRNKPFLSTREAFTLKPRANAALLTRYRAADEAGRRALLKEIDTLPLPPADEFGETPSATDIEWFFSGTELCTLVTKVADEPAMRINPGLAKAADWQQIAFKGGSEGGVLNLTSGLTGKNGKHYCVAATWNNIAALDQTQFFTTYNNILSTLAKESAR